MALANQGGRRCVLDYLLAGPSALSGWISPYTDTRRGRHSICTLDVIHSWRILKLNNVHSASWL